MSQKPQKDEFVIFPANWLKAMWKVMANLRKLTRFGLFFVTKRGVSVILLNRGCNSIVICCKKFNTMIMCKVIEETGRD